MKTARLILSLLVLVMTVCTLTAQERRALAVGIGQYEDPSWGKINADNDLEYVSEILDMYDFDDVTFLKNTQATKEAIVKAFADLSRRCHMGDIVYVHFSGHGQQVKDIDGDEEDGFDESWIPYDAYRQCCKEDDGSRHLIDDEINLMLAELRRKVGKSGQILVVVDACHSGKSSRLGKNVHEDFICRGVRDAFIPECRVESGELISEDWLLISACEDYQVNYEVRKPRVGKLTYCLYKLRSLLPKMSNDGLKAMLEELMESDEMIAPLPQNPHIDGNQYMIKH